MLYHPKQDTLRVKVDPSNYSTTISVSQDCPRQTRTHDTSPPFNLGCQVNASKEEIDLTLSREAVSSLITIKTFNLPFKPYMS